MTHHSAPKVAVIGCGYWGRNLVRNFEGLGVLAAIADGTSDGRKLASQLAPKAEIFSDLTALVEREDIHAIALATPAATHFDLGKRVLAAGKDLFVEKPMALTLDDARRLVDLADQHQRMLQ